MLVVFVWSEIFPKGLYIKKELAFLNYKAYNGSVIGYNI